MSGATSSDAWHALTSHFRDIEREPLELCRLFEADPERARDFSVEAGGLFLDYSRNLVTRQSLAHLLDWAHACNVPRAIEAMFAGERINVTEDRAALHVALRGHEPPQLPEAGNQVADVLARMESMADTLQQGRWLGCDDRPITDVVHIGIGGSELGPAMVSEVLRPWQPEWLRCHYVSNIDPDHLQQTLAGLEPATTLFIVASKSFGTAETLANARRARHWYLQAGGDSEHLARHFIAVTNNREAAVDFGMDPRNILPLPEWVGGRYSLWSAIGLPVALTVGMPMFRRLLTGAHRMDRHFHEAPLARNMPVIMGLLAYWYAALHDAGSQLVLPYARRLRMLPAYLQQLEMESLGKGVRVDGTSLDGHGAAALWGGTGTDSQHSFHQMLHQGRRLLPVDFIAAARPLPGADAEAHRQLLANCFSQSQTLMQGRDAADIEAQLRGDGMDAERARWLAAHRHTPGNRPSSTLLLPRLDAESLGSLLALYEHRVYVQATLWRINAFDQWGVELGKTMSRPLDEALASGSMNETLDRASHQLVTRTRTLQQSEEEKDTRP